jgi:hypothetical protein
LGETGTHAYALAAGVKLPAGFDADPSANKSDEDWNIAPYFVKQGAKLPPGTSADYYPQSKILIICDTLESLKLDDQLAASAGFRPMAVSLELSALECSFPPGSNPLITRPLTYADVELLPKKSVTILDRVSATANSGERVFANHIVNPAKAGEAGNESKTQFAADEWGTLAETETYVASDGVSSEVNINFRFRKQLDAKDPKSMQDIHFTTSFSCSDEHPLVLNVSSVPGHEGTFVVITACTRLVGQRNSNAVGKHAGDAVGSPKP